MDRKMLVGVSGLGVAMLACARLASADVQLQPQAVPVGGMVALPIVEFDTVYDDNIYGVSQNEAGSFYQVVNPTVHLFSQDRLNVYDVMYSMKAGLYANDSNDSYLDQLFSATAHVEPNGRLKLDGALKYAMLHDDRGTGYTSGIGLANILAYGEVDKYDLSSVGGALQYGADDALGRFVLQSELSHKRYSRDKVAAARDVNGMNSLAGLRMRLSGKTTALFDYERQSSNFTGALTPDTTDNRYLVGLTWQDTVQTTGKVRFGSGKRKTDGGKTVSKPTWDLGMVWSPLVTDVVNLDAVSHTTNADQVGGTDQGKMVNLAWNHSWASRISSRAGLGWGKDTFVDPKDVKYRSDTTKQYQLGVQYQMRRWLVLNSNVSIVDRSSDVGTFDTKRSIYSVGVQLGL